WAWLYLHLRRIYLAIKRDPRRFEYTDLAMTPVADDEAQTHELFRTDAAQAYIGQEQRLEKARHRASV
ncbi:MAG: radical SAM protein, partial [Xanthobacteraceae bacterium]